MGDPGVYEHSEQNLGPVVNSLTSSQSFKQKLMTEFKDTAVH